MLSALYLIFTEGYAASSENRWTRSDLASEALRLGCVLAELVPREAEVHGLVALMEFQACRFAARVTADGNPVLLADQDRTRWDHSHIQHGSRALARANSLGHGRGNYAFRAAIAQFTLRPLNRRESDRRALPGARGVDRLKLRPSDGRGSFTTRSRS